MHTYDGKTCPVITVTVNIEVDRLGIPERIPVSKRRLINSTVTGLVASRLIILYVSKKVNEG